MIRRISFAILIASSTLVLSQPLYKWVEADGSITFSPIKPTNGISYETVNKPTIGSSQNSSILAPASALPTNQAAPNTADSPAAIPEYSRVQSTIVPAGETGRPATSVAPVVRSNKPGSEAARQISSNLPGKSVPLATGQAQSKTIATSSSNNKQKRCQDLRKRVVSLERRLKSRLTPEDMDNTVVHMARYQRNFDQHCVQ